MIIKKQFCDLLEQLCCETNALKDLLSFMIKDGVDIESKNFLMLQEKYIEKYIEYDIAKNELSNFYNIKNKNWNLNFDTMELTVYEN